MKFRVLILANKGIKAAFSDDLETWQDYESKRLGLEIEVDVKYVDIGPLVHKSFGIVSIFKDPVTGNEIRQDMYGLDNIKEIVRAAGVVPQAQYHAVIFLYDFEGTALYKTNPGAVGHWTYFDQLYPGTEFIEIATTLIWDKTGDIFRVLSHEIRHAYTSRVRRRGYGIPDVMDRTPVTITCGTHTPNPTGACTEFMPYYKEYEPYATDGNRATQDALVRPLLARVVEAPELTGYISYLKAWVAELQAKINNMLKGKDSPGLIRWAEATKQHEGWSVGSRSYRNNNPGNFRMAPFIKSLGAIDEDESGYAIFPTYAIGWEALLEFLRTARANQLRAYRAYAQKMQRAGGIPLLKDFYAVYSPDSDNVPVGLSSSLEYAQNVATYIGNGVTVETPITQI